MRRAAVVLAVILGFAVFAPRVGERDRSELNVVSALRAIVSGELAYASMNHGYYNTLSCLAVPSSCAPGLRGEQQAFLDPELAAAREWYGYRLEFHDGPRGQPSSDPLKSRSGMTSFAVVAIPVKVATVERRSFCTDDRQLIYFTRPPSVPRVEAGRCLDTANPLR